MLNQIDSNTHGYDWIDGKRVDIFRDKRLLNATFESDQVIIVFDDSFIYLVAMSDGDCCEPGGYFEDAKFDLDFHKDKKYVNTPEPAKYHVDMGIISQEEFDEYKAKRKEFKEERDKKEKLDQFEKLKQELKL